MNSCILLDDKLMESILKVIVKSHDKNDDAIY